MTVQLMMFLAKGKAFEALTNRCLHIHSEDFSPRKKLPPGPQGEHHSAWRGIALVPVGYHEKQ